MGHIKPIAAKLYQQLRRGTNAARTRKRSRRAHATQDIDKELVHSLSRSRIPSWRQFTYIGRFLSSREKVIISVAAVIFAVSGAILVTRVYRTTVIDLPARGGSYTETLTGAPKLVNPLYAPLSTVDSDIVSLVYAGLLQRNRAAELIPGLAENFSVSDDRTTYTFTLREDLRWHDGEAVQADDVAFTIAAIKNPAYQSPLRTSFSGITASAVDERTVVFELDEPYPAFTSLLTVGILPLHIWENISPESATLATNNLKPIGAGPFKFSSLAKDAETGAVRVYELEVFDDYFGERAYLDTVVFRFNPTFQESVRALNEGRADGMDYIPAEGRDQLVAKKSYQMHYLQQPQVTALFFNQAADSVVSDTTVRTALAYATDKELIAETNPAFMAIDTPIPPVFNEYRNPDVPRYMFNEKTARTLLEDAGWQLTATNETAATSTSEDMRPVAEGTWYKKGDQWLAITITTADQSDTRAAAEAIAEQWRALNIAAAVELIDPRDIQGEYIRPRAYEALLYGYLTGADPNPFAFWHSTQTGAQGLNLANVQDSSVDDAIEATQAATTQPERVTAYQELQTTLAELVPAVFLYSHAYPYVQSNAVHGFTTTAIIEPSNRFSTVTDWYVETKKRLNIFQ
jgi:peptide/nickel transport system substrate-binding protein